MTYVDEALAAVNAELPGLDPGLARSYALLALTTGTRTTPRHVHDAWAMHARPDHPCLVPADELPTHELDKDRRVAVAIRSVARRLHARPEPPVSKPVLDLPPLRRGQHLTGTQKEAAASELMLWYRKDFSVRQLAEVAGPGWSFGRVLDLLASAGGLRRRGGSLPRGRTKPVDGHLYPSGVLATACDDCGAEAGQLCRRRRSGPRAGEPAATPHVVRVEAARAAPVIVDGTTIPDATLHRTSVR